VLHSDAILDRNAKGRVGNLLYATLCMPQSDICTSAFTSIQTVVKNNRVLLGLDSTLGAVVGAFIVLLIFFSHMRSHSMSQQLRRAIRRKEVSILYQPIVDLETGKIVRAEALARWKDEEEFAVSPEIFVRLAEERGFIDELTKLVVHTVLQDFGTALRSESNFHMNINVTATDLHGGQLMPMLREALTNAGVAPSRLAIEITEGSTVKSSVERVAIRQLRDAGHSVQIDDFGTGCSSLAYLKDLSVDTIKIDKAFTMAIGTEAVTLGILPQILAMAETLHLQVVVEGIETVEQAAYFAGKERPVLGQGWLFGKPMAADDLLCMMIRKPDYEEELSGDDLVVRKGICSSRS
jgi:sensor c-di-GMP phosphodiesterase-like protein